MKYEIDNIALMERYKSIYEKAESDNNVIQCIIGIDSRYRIITKDSYFQNISDTDAIFEYCIYPVYLSGDVGIKERIEKKFMEMSNSNDVLEVFQVFRFIMSQDMLCKIYEEIPFIIDFSSVIKVLMMRKGSYENEMKTYKKNGFEVYKESLWDNIQRIIRKSNTFKRATK